MKYCTSTFSFLTKVVILCSLCSQSQRRDNLKQKASASRRNTPVKAFGMMSYVPWLWQSWLNTLEREQISLPTAFLQWIYCNLWERSLFRFNWLLIGIELMNCRKCLTLSFRFCDEASFYLKTLAGKLLIDFHLENVIYIILLKCCWK